LQQHKALNYWQNNFIDFAKFAKFLFEVTEHE